MNPCTEIANGLGELFKCDSMGAYVRIRTPFMYPDGDVVDLFLDEEGGNVTLTDLGETLRWLRTQAVSLKRSPRQLGLIEDVCLTQGTELFKDALWTRVRDGESLASAAIRLAGASVKVADLWFTMRTRSVQSATDEVAEFLTVKEIPFTRSDKLIGRSGRLWTIDFHTRTSDRTSLVSVLSTGSRASARGVVEHVVAAWYDLSQFSSNHQFVSLFDDHMDVWSPEDFRLAADLSTLARWSNPDEFGELLKAA